MAEASMAVLLLIALLAPALVLAVRGLGWGPGIHIQLTQRVLEQVAKRREPREAERLVLAHKDAFYYGNIAADIVNFKNYGGVKNHCHHWNIQDRLNALASSDFERACVL